MIHARHTRPNSLVCIIAFEGPDPYSQAGGLSARVTGMSDALASLGLETHLFFIGDPERPHVEHLYDRGLTLHRWAQWISANCPNGVYDGEAGKVADLTASLPKVLVEDYVMPALAVGRRPILLFEEWQTAECACRVADMLGDMGAGGAALIAWNANHAYGFDRIDWLRLSTRVQITTVSRHMRSIIRSHGADARVIPSGIPSDALTPVAPREVDRIRACLRGAHDPGLFFKVARWDRSKGWMQALDAVGNARRFGKRLRLIARASGPIGRGGELEDEAESRGLRTIGIECEDDFHTALASDWIDDADVINLRFKMTPVLARTLYAAADGVLVNSIFEPFGLVGLEAMAAGGVAYTGGTGEDYAVAGRNAVVLETLDPREIVRRWEELATAPEATALLRRRARKTAQSYEWPVVASKLFEMLGSSASTARL